MPLLSVIVPVYNEAKTVAQIIEKIRAVPIDKEIIIVEDCSTDGTLNVLQDILKMSGSYGTKVIYHSDNHGKGASVKDGIREATGEFVVIQDADLEYDPREYTHLLQPLSENQADLVLGSRFKSGNTSLFLHRLGSRFLTGMVNFLFGAKLNDYATCYKMARKATLVSLDLKMDGFNIDVEIICKALKGRLRIVEVPIAYYPRGYAEGKKTRWFHGFQALASILKHRLIA
jgi:glycosyltransferase involved in cell wall biosynthesis